MNQVFITTFGRDMKRIWRWEVKKSQSNYAMNEILLSGKYSRD
jgi:hypothetical protein